MLLWAHFTHSVPFIPTHRKASKIWFANFIWLQAWLQLHFNYHFLLFCSISLWHLALLSLLVLPFLCPWLSILQSVLSKIISAKKQVELVCVCVSLRDAASLLMSILKYASPQGDVVASVARLVRHSAGNHGQSLTGLQVKEVCRSLKRCSWGQPGGACGLLFFFAFFHQWYIFLSCEAGEDCT